MLVRAIALSIALLFGIGTIIPYMTDSTEAGKELKNTPSDGGNYIVHKNDAKKRLRHVSDHCELNKFCKPERKLKI